jgi:peptide/nickel transport system substrate-binding protein
MPVQTSPKHVTIKIKSGIYFHNGDMLTATDVAATYNACKEKGAIWAGPLQYLVKAVAVNHTTVKFTFSQPYTALLDYAAIIPVMHRDYIKNNDVAMGTGPYQWVKYVQNTSVHLKAWPKYRGGAPKTPNIVFQVVPNSATQLVDVLQGSVDILPMPAYTQVSSLKKSSKVIVYESNAPVDIYFWLSAKLIPDVRIRQAICYAMDREKVVQDAYAGYATPASGPISPSQEGYSGSAHLYGAKPNYAKARALMKEAGMTTFSFPYISTTEPQQQAMAQILQQSWAEVGLTANLEISTYDAWQTAWVGGNWGVSTLFSMDGFAEGLGPWAVTDPLRSNNPINFGAFDNAQITKDLTDVYSAPSEAARIKLWADANTIAQQQAAQCPPVYPKFLCATGSGVKGLPTSLFRVTKLDLRNVTVSA